jgi:hypothetical protein
MIATLSKNSIIEASRKGTEDYQHIAHKIENGDLL